MITSYSQVKAAEECLRRWAFPSYGGRYEAKTDPQVYGDDLHAHIENYVRYGIEFDETKSMARLAALGRSHFPCAADDPRIEEEDLVTYGAHQYRVKPDTMWFAPCGAVVQDHKSVEHYRYALTPTKLRTALQACTYAYYAMKVYGTETAVAQWLYFKRSEPIELLLVETEITYEDALRVLRAKQKLVDQMADLKRRQVPVLELPATRAACLKYGVRRPCYHLGVCFPEEAVANGNV